VSEAAVLSARLCALLKDVICCGASGAGAAAAAAGVAEVLGSRGPDLPANGDLGLQFV
jgi:hypothetical protein